MNSIKNRFADGRGRIKEGRSFIVDFQTLFFLLLLLLFSSFASDPILCLLIIATAKTQSHETLVVF